MDLGELFSPTGAPAEPDAPDSAAQDAVVPDGWTVAEVEGLRIAYPPDHVESEEGRQLQPEAIIAVEGPEEDGVRPLLTVTSVTPGNSVAVELRTDFLLETLPDTLPGVEVAERSVLQVEGADEAELLRYTYPRGEFSTDVVQAVSLPVRVGGACGTASTATSSTPRSPRPSSTPSRWWAPRRPSRPARHAPFAATMVVACDHLAQEGRPLTSVAEALGC